MALALLNVRTSVLFLLLSVVRCPPVSHVTALGFRVKIELHFLSFTICSLIQLSMTLPAASNLGPPLEAFSLSRLLGPYIMSAAAYPGKLAYVS